MLTTLMQIEGVLANTQSDVLVENSPLMEGMSLYRALKTLGAIGIYSSAPEDKARYWLQRERLDDPLFFYQGTDDVERMITQSRATGHDLMMFVSANPAHVAASYRMGLQALLFVHPSYGRPEWKPDYEQPKRPWDEIVTEIENGRVDARSTQP